MINNVINVDTRMPMAAAKAAASAVSIPIPPVIAFKTPFVQEKTLIRVKKFKRSDNIVITGEIEDDYVNITEAETPDYSGEYSFNFIRRQNDKKQIKFLKNCYVIDYIQSPKPNCGLGTAAVKSLAEKAMFDRRTEGRIVTFSAPVWKESSPALFFYKLGFRFMDKKANDYMEECLIKKVPDLPPQTGMMYLPKVNLNRLLRYGDLI